MNQSLPDPHFSEPNSDANCPRSIAQPETLSDLEIITDVELVEEKLAPNRRRSQTQSAQPSTPQSTQPSTPQSTQPSTQPSTARNQTSIFERMLSPQSLQIMMAAGGGILAIGFAIWLWSIGLFDNPIIAAVGMGSVNLGLLAAGVLLVTRTRYTLAGRGLTFLSSLLMPLHLWFYDAQGLISVAAGGQLWIPALIICGLYALIARLTRNSIFVYTLVGGIVLTGLLFLSTPQTAFLWAVIPTCTFLVVLGTISIHVDRLFIESTGAFSRDEFGRAFFRAGHAVVIGGLTYLLTSQTAEFLFNGWMNFPSGYIGNTPNVNFWSLPILGIAGWAYAFSHTSRRTGSLFVVAAILVAIWAGLTALQVFSIALTPNLILMLIAAGLVALQVGLFFISDKSIASISGNDVALKDNDPIVLSVANFMLAALGIGQALLALLLPGDAMMNHTFIAQAVFTVLSLGLGTEIGLGERDRVMSNVRLAGGSLLATLITVLAISSVTATISPVVIGIVLSAFVGLAVINQFIASPRIRLSFSVISTAAVGGILITLGAGLMQGGIVFGSLPALAIVATCGALLMQVGYVSGHRGAWVASLLVLALGLAQSCVILEITSAQPIIISISVLGMLISVGTRLLSKLKTVGDQNSEMLIKNFSFSQDIGSLLIGAGSVASLLFVFPHLLLEQATIVDCGLLLFQLLPLAVGYFVNKTVSLRHSFWALAIANLGLMVVTFTIASEIALIYRVELIAMVAGVVLLVIGHLGWAKEDQTRTTVGADETFRSSNHLTAAHRDSVSISLMFGGILLAMPMMVGVIAFRMFGVDAEPFWKLFHEIGTLVIGLSLLGSGILCHIRSTTIAGFTTMLAYLVSLVALIRLPAELQSVSVMMMIGGGVFFGTAILLSLYRDWLLGLPAKIRDGSGVFKVLKWR